MEKKNFELARDLRRLLHQNPEASEKEVKTKAILMDFLRKHTDLELFDRGKWFYAMHREKGAEETIGFRADFDAILGEGGICYHGCGHDGHAASLAGFGLELQGKKIGKNILLLFQHAEENGAGAKDCVPVIEEEGVSKFFAQHNFPGRKQGVYHLKGDTVFCASKGMNIHLKGRQSHASQPEEGINPSYLIAELVKKVEPLMQFHGYGPILWEGVSFQSMVLCTIVHLLVGEKAFGVSPSIGELCMTLRARKEEDLVRLQSSLEEFVSSEAKKRGLTVSFEYQDEFPETANDPELTCWVVERLEEHGMGFVLDEEPFRGSEDFGHISKRVPSCYLIIGNGEEYTPIHNILFEFPDENIPPGVDLFMMLATS